MGAWGEHPVDNDTAADWFGDLMDKTKLPNQIEKALKSGEPEIQRVAAWLLGRIGYTYVYDIDALEKHLALAIEKLEEILKGDWIKEWVNQSAVKRSVRKQIKVLEDLQK